MVAFRFYAGHGRPSAQSYSASVFVASRQRARRIHSNSAIASAYVRVVRAYALAFVCACVYHIEREADWRERGAQWAEGDDIWAADTTRRSRGVCKASRRGREGGFTLTVRQRAR